MASTTDAKIYRLAAICGCITAFALVAPRFVPNREGGFASAAAAILVFLGLLLAAAVLSIYLLVVTIRAYRDLSPLPRFAGIGPSVVLVIALAVLLGLLRY